jgi:methyl-accepting chemotaxis protein
MSKTRRKRYVIAARFQMRYILYILLFLYIGAAIAGYTVYYSTWTTLGEKLASVYPRGRLIYIFRQANVTLLIRLLLVSPFFVIIGVILSHRIAGPIYRIGKYVESVMRGDYSHGLTLRKNDEFKVLARKMTLLCKKLRDDDVSRKKRAIELQDILKENRVSGDVLEKAREILGEMTVTGPAGVMESDRGKG